MINYYFLDDEYWKDYPSIPHTEKFVHNFGIIQMFDEEKLVKTALLYKFSNDK